MLLQMALFHSFLWLSNIPLYIYHILFIYSSVNGHLGCFDVLAIVNSAAVNIEVYVSFQFIVFSGYMPRNGIAGSDFTFMHWGRKWQPTPVFLPGESRGRGSLVGCRPWGLRESDTTEAT